MTTNRTFAATRDSFVVFEAPVPEPTGHDLLVEVRAVSVNPVDVKVRAGLDEPRVLGFDAAGVVVAVGPDVTGRAVGDEVYYAGSIDRDGSNARYQLVDERIVGRKPATLSFADAAALPLTSITAWEALFDKLHLSESSTGTLLVVGGAGGTGSMVIQLARALTGVTVVASAGRTESARWATDMGAHRIVGRDLTEAGAVDYIFSPFSDGNVEVYAEILAVQGQVVAIDDPEGLDTMPLKSKSQSWQWEFMFAKPLHLPEDSSQQRLLDRVADLVDDGTLRSTATTTLSPIDVETLTEAHRVVESSGAIGKIVVALESA
ncbi:NADPH:quinone reductase [Rhodococcoides trifolii]|uniref:Zinc-type alcohol dehydrogenase-like protein n=1 Tax=Rhodococcoides trifolii TaxID=908250 RepID=A0A917G151_9NOCA|nr:zinc-binding alcohol dehydrogenase family protein [Rhodococcus trifolii]GGG17748.1 NADPH:quinone reductase [Rhodococcus trifolii]